LTRATPHLGAAAVCVGLASSNVVRVPSTAGALTAGALLAMAFATPRGRSVGFAAALAVVGLTWASARLDALDRSPLTAEIGHAGHAQLVVTGPARRSPFDVRFTAQARSFGVQALREPVLVRIPPGRAPPEGAIVREMCARKRSTTPGRPPRAPITRRCDARRTTWIP
jgi:hypothetical protein